MPRLASTGTAAEVDADDGENERLANLKRMTASSTSWTSWPQPNDPNDESAAPESGPLNAWDLIDDDDWFSGEDDERDDLSLEDARAAFLDALSALTGEELVALFPERDVSLDVAEGIDDLVPIIRRAELPAVEAALDIVEGGLERCAQLKTLANTTLPSDERRKMLKEIREDKSKILSMERPLLDRQRTLEAEAQRLREAEVAAAKQRSSWSSDGARSSGFGGPDAARQRAETLASMKRTNDETNRKIEAMREETRRKQDAAWKRQNDQFLRLIQGRRY